MADIIKEIHDLVGEVSARVAGQFGYFKKVRDEIAKIKESPEDAKAHLRAARKALTSYIGRGEYRAGKEELELSAKLRKIGDEGTAHCRKTAY